MCTCFAESRLSPPPFEAAIIVDADGYLGLDLPYEGNETAHRAFDRWTWSNPCGHRDMCVVSEWVDNWSGYQLFRDALAAAGWDHLPVLHRVLPTANGGIVAPDDSATALIELETFERWAGHDLPALFDTESNRELHRAVRSSDIEWVWKPRELMWNPHEAIGLDDDGLFVRAYRPGRPEIFRAKRIAQHVPRGRRRRGRAKLLGLDTSQVCWIHDVIGEDDRGRYPRRLHVAPVHTGPGDFAHELRVLRRLFTASVETGNPVRWA